MRRLQTKITKRKSHPTTILSLKWAAAAAVIIVLGLGSYLFVHQSNQAAQTAQQQAIKDIAPGSNKAVLTLANGRKINLADEGEGKLAQQNNVAINKAKNGEISYDMYQPSNGRYNYSVRYTYHSKRRSI